MVTTCTRLIVPLDGSTDAEVALLVATRLARCTGAKLRLVRAVPLAREDETRLESSLVRPSEYAAVEAAGYLRQIAGKLQTGKLEVETTLWRGDAAGGIIAAIGRDASSVVVMGSHGRTSRGRWLLGSVARQVVGSSPVPVLLVRTGGRPLPPASPYTELPQTALNVMVPLDGSTAAEAALGPAIGLLGALAAPGQGCLHLVHVAPAFGGDWGMEESRARAYLRAVRDRVAAQIPLEMGHTVTWSVLFETEAAPAIVRLAAQGDSYSPPANAIVIASSGQGGGALRRILGRVSEQVLYGSRVPVMVVRYQKAIPDLASELSQDVTAEAGDEIAGALATATREWIAGPALAGADALRIG